MFASDKSATPFILVGAMVIVAIVLGVFSLFTAPKTDVLGISDGPRGMVQPVSLEEVQGH